MVNNSRLIKIIVLIISLSSINAQSNAVNNSYWIYTASSEMKDIRIIDIEKDQLVLNNGSWDVKVPLADIESIALSPGPSSRGQFLGKNVGACGGLLVGFIAGVIVFPRSDVNDEEISGLKVFIIAGALGGGYFGRKMGGNYLKADPEILVDMIMWTVVEKKKYIQTNLIY